MSQENGGSNRLKDAIDKEFQKLHILGVHSVNESDPYKKICTFQVAIWMLQAQFTALLTVLDQKYHFDDGAVQKEFLNQLQNTVHIAEQSLNVQITDSLKIIPGIRPI